MSEGGVALVTGAAGGIGWAIARNFAAGGRTVVIADLRGPDAEARARELAADYPGSGRHVGLACDVSREDDVKRAIATCDEHFGRLDVVVNNAGAAHPYLPTLDQGLDDFERTLRVHASGTFLVSRESARLMIGSGKGAIVNISSLAAIVGLPRRNGYGAAKAAMVSLTRSMACEWAPHGIRVNAVAPGYVGTDLVRKLAAEGSIDMKRVQSRIPMGRLAEPEDIANAVGFLCSEQAAYITGTVITVDGGWAAFGDAGPASAAE